MQEQAGQSSSTPAPARPSDAVSLNRPPKSRLLLLATGGTIAGQAPSAADAVGYVSGQLSGAQLVHAVPALAELADISVEQVCNIGSEHMQPSIWAKLAARVNVAMSDALCDGVVITHGTDTLEETAYFLSVTVGLRKPLVLTAAMRPASHEAADGPQNLLDAVRVACQARAADEGVLAVLSGRAHGALTLRKLSCSDVDAFESDAPQALIREGVVHWQSPRAGAARTPSFDPSRFAKVEIVTSYAGADGAVIDALVAVGSRGIVIAGTGNGTMSESFEAACARARAAGVKIMLSTRVARGEVRPSRGDSDECSGALNAAKARIWLALRLGEGS